MLTKDQLDELRPVVAREPEGSPARILLAAYDELIQEQAEDDDHALLKTCKNRHPSEEDCRKLIAFHKAGGKIEIVDVACWACNYPFDTGTIKCHVCHGRGETWQFKVPA